MCRRCWAATSRWSDTPRPTGASSRRSRRPSPSASSCSSRAAPTAVGAGAAASGISVPRELTVDGRDGYPVHGWVAKPEGEGPFPVILQIHGGPFASYGVHLFDETQVLVDAGYAVVYSNPRGSAGYGRAHGRAIRQAMGTVDFTDVIDFLE